MWAFSRTPCLLTSPLASSSFPFSPPSVRFPPVTRSVSSRSFRLTRFRNSLGVEMKPTEKEKEDLPEFLTEFMVDMTCGGCVNAVKNKLTPLDGVKQVDVDLDNQVVKVLGTLSVKNMLNAFEQIGQKARLIGQGNPLDFLISAAVAEYKGPTVFGVVRIAQINMELSRIEANFSGLSTGKHAWAINEFGDLTEGPVSTGKMFNPPLGDLGTLDVNENGEAYFSDSKQMLRVSDLIGRSIVVYETEDRSDNGLVAAVIARSSGVGENYKKLCSCDGVTIWESS